MIQMRRVANARAMEGPGDFYWYVHPTGTRVFWVAIPCNNAHGWLRSPWTIDHPNETGDQWTWDGNEDKPTLSPSLHAVGFWHGWVKHGVMSEA